MTPINRAGWGRVFKFSESDRKALSEILKKHDPLPITNYLNIVEQNIMFLRMDWQSDGDVPPEQPGKARAVLNRISKHSMDLYKAIDELDSSGSLLVMSFMLGSLGRGMETIDYMQNDLPLIHVCANKASETTMEGKRGRPADVIERNFIGYLGQYYVAMFGKKPTYSRNTEFPRFVRKVLEIALPGNPHTAKDNSKIVKAALTAFGVIGSKKTTA